MASPFNMRVLPVAWGFKWYLLCTAKIRSGGGKFPVNYCTCKKHCLDIVLLKCAWRWHCQNLPMCGYLVITMSSKSFCHELQYLCTWYNYIPKSSCEWADRVMDSHTTGLRFKTRWVRYTFYRASNWLPPYQYHKVERSLVCGRSGKGFPIEQYNR